MDNAQDKIDEMINDLNSVNDDFVTGYFDDTELEPVNIKEMFDTEDETEEVIDNSHNEKKEILLEESNQNLDFSYSDILERLDSKEEVKSEKPFSYNEILDKLDVKKEVDINNSNDILNLIENSISSDEFFDAIEENLDD